VNKIRMPTRNSKSRLLFALRNCFRHPGAGLRTGRFPLRGLAVLTILFATYPMPLVPLASAQSQDAGASAAAEDGSMLLDFIRDLD